MVPWWKRLILSLLGVIVGASLAGGCIAAQQYLASVHGRFSSTALAATIVIFDTWVVLLSLPGWLLAVPLVLKVRNIEGRRFWLCLAAGACFGPALVVAEGLVFSTARFQLRRIPGKLNVDDLFLRSHLDTQFARIPASTSGGATPNQGGNGRAGRVTRRALSLSIGQCRMTGTTANGAEDLPTGLIRAPSALTYPRRKSFAFCSSTSRPTSEIASVSGMPFGQTSTQFCAYPHSWMPPSPASARSRSSANTFPVG